jgi:hypothetical protein
MKDSEKYMSRDLDVPAQLDDVMRVFRANKIARTSTTIRALWEKTGFGSMQRKRTYYLLLMKGKFAQFPNLQKFGRSIAIKPSCQRAEDNINGAGSTKAISASNHGNLQKSKE